MHQPDLTGTSFGKSPVLPELRHKQDLIRRTVQSPHKY
jgi:hypothetical protein